MQAQKAKVKRKMTPRSDKDKVSKGLVSNEFCRNIASAKRKNLNSRSVQYLSLSVPRKLIQGDTKGQSGHNDLNFCARSTQVKDPVCEFERM
jgi:hypothetical protein